MRTPAAEIDRLRADLVARHGEQRAHTMAEVNRNMLIYPNLIINDIMAVTVRTFYPPAPDAVDVTAWELAPVNELPTLRQRRLDSFLTFLGPGGFATPDDVEALESCQQGFASGGVAMERHLPRHGSLSDGQRRGTDARLLAALAASDGRSGGPGRCPVTAAWQATASRQQVEDFLYAEAALLDAWRLDDWLLLFDEDAKYEVPCNDAVDGDPARDLMLIDDNYARLAARVARLNSRHAHREFPHSRTNHQVFNVRVDASGDGISVTASFTVWRFRAGRSGCYVGRYRYRLRRRDGGFRIAFKRAELDMTDLRGVAEVAIIL